MHRIVDLLLICSFLHPYFYCIEGFVKPQITCEKPYWFQCDNGKCISLVFECDKFDDCGDNSDEKNCENFKLVLPASVQCATDEFRCENSECIPKRKFCDAVNDCTDGSDEYVGCVKKLKCDNHKFRCADEHCIEKDWICDGIKDCPDGSDEQNCDNKILNASDCTNKNDRYLCKNQRCISLSTVCNKKDNCGDGSDEGVGCNNSKTSCVSIKCSNICRMTPNGPVCVCQPGYSLQDNRTCIDIDECATYGICDQRCINTKGSYKCICQTGYTLLDDMRTCKADGGEATMIYSMTTEIRAMFLDTETYFTVVQNLSQAIAVTVNGDHIYWSELEKGNEMIVKSDYGRKREAIVTVGLDTLSDIAIDWITGNIYFTDIGHTHIGICDNSGTNCTILIDEQTGLIDEHPTALALLPTNGVMYWSDWGFNGHIAMAGMDGTNNRFFVTENITWPKSVTIDYPNNRLYWVDAKRAVVESIRLDGTDRRIVLNEFIQHPFSLAVFENKLYWSDWTEKTIQSCNKFTGKDWKIITRSSNIPYGIHIDHLALKPRAHNPCNPNPCSQLCMLNQNKNYTCACTLDKKLNPDGHTCRVVDKRQHIIIAAKGAFIDYYHELLGRPKITANVAFSRHITAVTYDSLSGTVFASDQFKNNIIRYDPVHGDVEIFMSIRNEILGGLAFDDIGNNLYLSDIEQKTIEIHSLSTTTSTTFYLEEQPYDIALVPEKGIMFVVFRGKTGYHIDKMQMNGIGVRTKFVDSDLLGPKVSLCYDRDHRKIFWSDQGTGRIESITITGFYKYLFRTGLKEPVSLAIAEEYIFWTEYKSNKLFWADKYNIHQKNNGIIIRMTDKVEIAHLVALHGIIVHEENGCRKNNGNCSHVCLPSSYISYICACPPEMMLSADNHTCSSQSACPPGQLKCSEHDICIKRQQWCNGIKECPNGEDEPIDCAEAGHCGKDKFMCKNGQCINKADRCNSNYDCSDKSDEDACKKISCQKDEFQCHEGSCISSSLVCNGQFDCSDTSDELNCGTRECSSNEFMCEMRKCIPESWKCDGQIDCPDGSDETMKICKTRCNNQQFRCANDLCISSLMKCDGFNDCGDHSDEQHCLNGTYGHTGNCTDDEYPCYNTDMCLPIRVKCNGVQDCPKNDDEHNCAYCLKNEFACNNQKCIPQSWVCDQIDDCGDKSDEKDCGRRNWKNTIANVTGTCEEFMCSDGTCLPFSKACDNVQDCPDGSDEQKKCTTSCVQDNRCHGICHKTPQGGICDCIKGYRLATDMVSCDDINECEHEVCSQMCHNTMGSFICSCFDGYIIRDDKISCKSIGPPMELITATDRDIRKISSNTRSIEAIHPLSGLSVGGLDVNAIDNTIYWSNDDLGTINKFNIKTKESKFVTGVGIPEVLAVDWITDNIYFNDNNRPNKIKVCNLEQEKCATIAKIEGVGKVTSIVVDPKNRWLFWSQTTWQVYNNPFSEIYQTDMMGSNMKIIGSRNIGVVSGMAIDHIKSKLYWTDSFYKTIELSNLDGTQRSTFLKTDKHQPLSISIYENSLYWLMGSNGQLQKCKLYGEKLCESINVGSDNIHKHFAILHVSNHPPAENPCKVINCNYMCVLKDKDAACICQDGKPIMPNNICIADTPNDEASFTSNKTYIRSEPVRHYNSTYSGLFIALVIIILILSGFFYYQRNKLKKTSLDNLSIRFQNPSYDRRDEIAATLISTASNISPGEHEYVNPINDKLLTIVEESETNQSETISTNQMGKEVEATQKQDALISFTR
ncbi:vitellogenin receptor-like isoform X2 [Odontomachus brunneus]|uniref:vitellogenin receptor-like isoform X2 n=1 Tax=Odontomachus brunneus TaxID=486640 RepID=UPI0013F18545|nr:vitellogenin receptor-like isoform X2 [Odontomachus brunneus]